MVPNIKKKIDTHATDFNQNGAFFLSSRGRLTINGNVRPANRDNMTGLFCSHNRKKEKASAKAFSLCIRCDPIFANSIKNRSDGVKSWSHRMESQLDSMR